MISFPGFNEFDYDYVPTGCNFTVQTGHRKTLLTQWILSDRALYDMYHTKKGICRCLLISRCMHVMTNVFFFGNHVKWHVTVKYHLNDLRSWITCELFWTHFCNSYTLATSWLIYLFSRIIELNRSLLPYITQFR